MSVMKFFIVFVFAIFLVSCDNKETALPEESTEKMSAAEKYYHLQRMRKYEQERIAAEEADKQSQSSDNVGYVEGFKNKYQVDRTVIEPLAPQTE